MDVDPIIIARGYVDDPRNTDNAWIETVASLIVIKHTPEPIAGDDAKAAQWFDIPSSGLEGLEGHTGPLYANHGVIVKKAIKQLNVLQRE